jgi:hypothetical protein
VRGRKGREEGEKREEKGMKEGRKREGAQVRGSCAFDRPC